MHVVGADETGCRGLLPPPPGSILLRSEHLRMSKCNCNGNYMIARAIWPNPHLQPHGDRR